VTVPTPAVIHFHVKQLLVGQDVVRQAVKHLDTSRCCGHVEGGRLFGGLAADNSLRISLA